MKAPSGDKVTAPFHRGATPSQHIRPDVDDAAIDHAERAGRSRRDVDDAAAAERSPVVDRDDYAAAALGVDEPHPRAEGQGAVRGRQASWIVSASGRDP